MFRKGPGFPHRDLKLRSLLLLLLLSLPPSLYKVLTAGSLAIFLLFDILKTCVTAVNRPPLFMTLGGEDATSAENRQEPYPH